MKYKIILLLPLFMSACSDDKTKAAASRIDTAVTSKPLAPSQQPQIIPPPASPEAIYTEQIKRKPDVWYLSELASFSFIAKKQIDLIRDIKNEGLIDTPLHRYKFLAQLHGIRTVLSYMRLPLNRVSRGDTAVIRSATLEAIRMSYSAKKTTHVGEAMLFSERAKEAYLKVNELCNRELLKQLLPAPLVPSELRVNIHKALDHVHSIFDDLEKIETAEETTLTDHILFHISQTYKAVTNIQEQTDGLGYLMNDKIFPSNMKTKNKKMLLNGASMENIPSVPNAYGLPSAESLLQSGNMLPQNNSATKPPVSNNAITSNRVSEVLATEAARGPYGITATPGTPPKAVVNSGLSALPSLGSLSGNSYPGAPQPQPSLPTIPAEIPPLPLPPPIPSSR